MTFGTDGHGGEAMNLNNSGMMPGESDWSFDGAGSREPSFEVPQNSTPNTAVAPTPDPAFSASPANATVKNVSWSASESQTPISGSTGTETPLVEAF